MLNQALRLSDWALILITGILSYYASNAYETFTAMGVQGLPASYLQVILLAMRKCLSRTPHSRGSG